MTAPTALWGSLVKSGYKIVYGDLIEGIPYTFGAREMWTIRGVPAEAPSAYQPMSYGLAILEGDRMSQEANRQEGLAAGRAVDFRFGRQQLADEGLGPILFARPTLRATLTGVISDPTATAFDVDDTTGWPEEGAFYIGREYVIYTSITATSFEGCSRGVAGYAHYHSASTFGAYAQCTDTPVYWRGRLVTRYAHLVSPEGRFLGEKWCTLGEFCRHEWRGFVRDTPRPEQAGMVIACLPLPRLAAQEFGAEVQGKMRPDWIVSEAADTITLNPPTLGDIVGPDHPITTNNGIMSLQVWCAIAENNMTGTYGEDTYLHFEVDPYPYHGDQYIRVRVGYAAANTVIRTNAWFLGPGEFPGQQLGYTSATTQWFLPLAWNSGAGSEAGAWIVVELEPDVDYSEAVIGDAGLLALDVGGHVEIVSYDETRLSSDATKRAFRIVARNLLGTTGGNWATSGPSGGYWNPWKNDTTVRVVAGASGTWNACLHTLLTSSGTGARGAYDTLPMGFGLGLPDDWIYGDALDLPNPVMAVTTGKTSVKVLLCGWLAMLRACLVQYRRPDGTIVLAVVSTDVTDDPEAEPLTDADVLTDGVETPEMMEPPNHVKVKASDILQERPTYVVRDAVRAQAEGVRALEITAPGITGDQARLLGAELIILGDGQAAAKFRLPPWIEIQVGDNREDTTEHPARWDWSAGSYAPSTIIGRAVTHERDFLDQTQSVTLLLAGQAQERGYLCPCALVTLAVSATVYRVEPGGALGFRVGDAVLFYERSNEDVDVGTAEITDIVEGDTYDTITVDADPTVTADELVITFDVYANATTRQRRFLYVRSDQAWR